jgi:NitT/TauT family transport system substrate-binding protein
MKEKIGIVLILMIVCAFSAGCIDTEPEEEPIKLVGRGGQDMVQQLGTCDIAGCIAWEPYPSEMIVKGVGEKLMDSDEIWSHHPCCIVAYDYNWYRSNEDADEILNRVVWVHMKTTDWINEAKDQNSTNHTRLIKHAEEFTKRDPEVIEMALKNIDFDYNLDVDGIEGWIDKAIEYDLFEERRWEESGYRDAEDYTDSLIDERYIKWAMDNADKTKNEITLNKTAEVRFGYLIEDLHHLAFWIALQEGWFEDAGINVIIAKGAPFQNGAFEMQQGFKRDEVDVGYLGIPPASIHRINTNDFSIDDARINVIAGVNYAGSAIVVGKGIDSMEDLAGETVGTPGKGTIQHLLFLMAAEDAGLTVEE